MLLPRATEQHIRDRPHGDATHRTRIAHLAALLGYFGLTIALTWPLAIRLGDTVPGLDPQLQAWTLGWNAHALRAQPAGVWNAPIFYPYAGTLAYTDNHLVLSALAAPLVWSGVAPMAVHNLLLLASFVLSGWAVFALARSIGCRTFAAFVGGAVFAFGAYRFAHLVHLNLLQTAWLVLALWGAVRMLDPRLPPRARWYAAALCGVFVGLQSVTALYYAYLSAASLALLGGLWMLANIAARRHARTVWAGIARIALAGSLAAAIALPLALPYRSVYESLAIVRSPAELENWSAPLQAYLAVPDGNRLYGSLGGLFRSSGGELTLFPGFVAVALAVLGLLVLSRSGRPWWERVFWPSLACVGFVLSLGTQLRLVRGGDVLPIPLPYAYLYRFVPGFAALRVPARWGWLVLLAVAVLSAWGLHGLLAQRRRRLAASVGALALVAVLLEQVAAPIALQPLPVAPPAYAWLARQTDATVVLELPIGPTPRGAELERIMRRQLGQLEHRKQLPVSYSGIIPFGATDILRRVQGLPDDEVLEYLELAGVDTLLIHAAEYEPAALDALREGLERSARVRLAAEVGGALVYHLERAALARLPGPGDVWISNSERMPGVLALALIRRWQAEGRTVLGAGRPRYYGALGETSAGHVAPFGLLAADEDPQPLGYGADALQWRAAGLALYAADPALRAAVATGAPPAGQFHPAYPAALELTVGQRELHVGAARVVWDKPLRAARVALDVASLGPATLTANEYTLDLDSGRNHLVVPVELGTPLELACPAASCAMLRVRVYEGAAAGSRAQAQDGAVASAETRFNGSTLWVAGRATGTREIVVEARGAAAADDKPVLLFQGVRLVAADGGWSAKVDLMAPAGDWLREAGEPVDGRYIAYISQPNAATPGRPIATFNIRNGLIVDAAPVPLPLSELVQ